MTCQRTRSSGSTCSPTYAAAQAVTVRRLAQANDPQIQSLGRLLHQIAAEDQGTITLEWWMSGWPTNWDRKTERLRLFESVAGAGATVFPAHKAQG